MARKLALGLLILALLAGAAALILPHLLGDDAKVLRVANQKGSTRATMLAAGTLAGAPYRVEWSEFPAAQTLLEAVASGAADIGLAADAPFIFAYESNSPIKAIGALAPGSNAAGALAVIVPRASALHAINDLVGKRIATTRGSIGHHLLLQALERAGIAPTRVTMTFLAPSDAKAAFDSKAIDAWAIWSPYLNIAIKEGARTIVDAREYGLPVGFDVANAAAIGPKRALLRDFLQREAKALDWARAHPDAFAAVLAKETGLPNDIARASFERNNRIAIAIDPALIAREQVIADRFAHAELILPKRAVADAFDGSVGNGLFSPQPR